jgi:hypothetical protein
MWEKMMANRKIWVYAPTKVKGFKVPDPAKVNIKARGDDFIETFLKLHCIQPPSKKPKFNYLVDIYSKWHGHYFYFCGKYACPGPNAISPFFDLGFARLEYIKNDFFNVSYHRHTGQWWQIENDLTLDECFKAIRNNPLLQP